MINELKPNQIFVFGSNLAGNHAGGAAKQAFEEFGAEMGVGEGMTGQCYAFPTLDKSFNKVASKKLIDSRDLLYHVANNNTHKDFLLTKVGCGIAGFEESSMARLFSNAPSNIVRPIEWQKY